LSSCCNPSERNRYITFINKSDKNIACQKVWSPHIITADSLFFCGFGATQILMDSIRIFECPKRDNGWEVSFNVIPFLQFSVMDDSIYEQYYKEPCDTIRKYVPILHIYQLTLEDLRRMNWTVVYPPEEE